MLRCDPAESVMQVTASKLQAEMVMQVTTSSLLLIQPLIKHLRIKCRDSCKSEIFAVICNIAYIIIYVYI